MLIKYDKKADAKYISLLPKRQKRGVVARTEKIESWLLVDFDSKGNVFGIEVLDASKHQVTLTIANNKVKFFPRVEKMKFQEREAMFADRSSFAVFAE